MCIKNHARASHARKSLISQKRGFTLIEILVVIGLIAILAAVVLVAVNPARQFAQARNSQRQSNIEAILNAIGENIADNKGVFTCPTYALTTTATDINKTSANIRPCLVSTYMSEIPVDPSTGSNTCIDTVPGDCASGAYDTGYTVLQDSAGRITICAPQAKNETAISGSAAICQTR